MTLHRFFNRNCTFSRNFPKIKPYMQWALILCWVMGMFWLFNAAKHDAYQQIRAELSEKSASAQRQIGLSYMLAYSMTEQMQKNIELAQKGYLQTYCSDRFVQYNQTWGLSPYDLTDLDHCLEANISGSGHFDALTPEIWQEIDAALALDIDLDTDPINHIEFAWSYYTSKNHFILYAPAIDPKAFQFSESLYEKPFWTIATPQNNPQRQFRISPIYLDAAGKGYMISLSLPVYVNDVFYGVVSLDHTLTSIRRTLENRLDGATLLVNNERQIVSAPYDFTPGDKIALKKPLHELARQHDHGFNPDKIVMPVIDDQMYLVHYLYPNGHVKTVLQTMQLQGLFFTSLILVLMLLIWLFEIFLKINRIAIHDELTHILNRRGVEQKAEWLFDLADREQQPVSVLSLDLDRFKQVNDTYGHSYGDKVIAEFGHHLTEHARKSDLAGRMGGEEFIMFLPNTPRDQAAILAERLLETLRHKRISDQNIQITTSIGCIERQPEESLNNVLKRADLALYQAKDQGRDQISFGPSEPDEQT
ncbi:sensor domain-containing diguanylate cyclase [Hydrogenovibrio halophilus]|uniref:sensor domain-containing diguanylate cyclase n=1 Tax=Hydrogenovibrio halophilus TaxID=373391 RepID=UPI0003A78579|nr:sensor domain-containing diguanylate cyclase [Hydrogenovibrio halophilus]